jgi:hypothetical protein
VTKGVARPTTISGADPGWHSIARQLSNTLAASGQADFYQQSDWTLAFSLCDDLSYFKNSTKQSVQMLQTVYSAMERLLVAEGDRRRVRIELHEPEDENATPASVVAIESYRRELGVAP